MGQALFCCPTRRPRRTARRSTRALFLTIALLTSDKWLVALHPLASYWVGKFFLRLASNNLKNPLFSSFWHSGGEPGEVRQKKIPKTRKGFPKIQKICLSFFLYFILLFIVLPSASLLVFFIFIYLLLYLLLIFVTILVSCFPSLLWKTQVVDFCNVVFPWLLVC